MLVIITYDVNTKSHGGAKRLRRVAKTCVDFGRRVQNSVFECELDASQFLIVKSKLLAIIDVTRDSLRLYSLGNNYKNRVEHHGVKPSFDVKNPLVI